MKILALARLAACAAMLLPLAGCDRKVPEPEPDPSRPVIPRSVVEVPEPATLEKEDVVVGAGAEAKEGDLVRVHYTGRLKKNNAQFDSSVGRDPLKFTIGKSEVIKGWEEGIAGMKVGGKRKLTIPSRLGYGDAGSPPKIPPKATLLFDVELIGIGEEAAPAPSGSAKAGKKPAPTPKKPAASKASE
ncbi:FKBP-type peptidyl-prolyl cis-trans isomerase [Chondromyces apiculatus]|uniref:Peptidyl-prolyl cis-trans isomerase n=1 Tax=Chondromyces apiculatus DSM 436 TaxID=1192034 RepID=A0A017TDK5_9BACT|nr:FKBP-type peptidyl-prolyl cis-trans isomerase [Chondromyces apiculatus]EYF06992.1 Peptidylprolyl isomerase [Chondromyces apiculatus DSM 436]